MFPKLHSHLVLTGPVPRSLAHVLHHPAAPKSTWMKRGRDPVASVILVCRSMVFVGCEGHKADSKVESLRCMSVGYMRQQTGTEPNVQQGSWTKYLCGPTEGHEMRQT